MKMLVENAALYLERQANVKLPWQSLLAALLSVMLFGCTPENKPAQTPPQTNVGSAAVSVPLRIWFVADPSDKPVIERQWQAADERPVELNILTATELLNQSKPQCDVLVYPAWMLGELVGRQWLSELPARLQSSTPTKESSDGVQEALPAGWVEQARFHRQAWGCSLAVIAPVVLGNFDIPKAREVAPNEAATADEAIAYWQSLIEALKKARQAAAAPAADQAMTEVDAQAVCDRYLTILFSVSDRENNIGTLFYPDNLKPRVTDSNFMTAAQILFDLHAAGASDQVLLGKHSVAWQALTESTPNVTIGIPPLPSTEADKVNSIIVSPPPANPAKAGMRMSTGWNSGRGLIVSLSKQCRQTGSSIDFVNWLSSSANRQVFAKRIDGITAESAFAPGSSAWQTQRIVQRLGQQPRLPSEPRLPQAYAYRQALGEQIASILQGKKSIADALTEVEKSWQAITAACDLQTQIPAYVQSLDL